MKEIKYLFDKEMDHEIRQQARVIVDIVLRHADLEDALIIRKVDGLWPQHILARIDEDFLDALSVEGDTPAALGLGHEET